MLHISHRLSAFQHRRRLYPSPSLPSLQLPLAEEQLRALAGSAASAAAIRPHAAAVALLRFDGAVALNVWARISAFTKRRALHQEG